MKSTKAGWGAEGYGVQRDFDSLAECQSCPEWAPGCAAWKRQERQQRFLVPSMHCRGARYCFSVLCIVLLQSQMLSPSYDPNSTLRHAWSARSMGTWLRVTNESFLSIPKNRDEFKCGHVSHEGSTQSSSESLRERGALSSTWDNECQSLLHYPALMSSQQVYHPKWPILSFVFLFRICILHENISSGRAGSALSRSLPYNQCLEQRLANSKCVLHICWMTKLYILAEGLPGVTLLQPRRAEKRERGRGGRICSSIRAPISNCVDAEGVKWCLQILRYTRV